VAAILSKGGVFSRVRLTGLYVCYLIFLLNFLAAAGTAIVLLLTMGIDYEEGVVVALVFPMVFSAVVLIVLSRVFVVNGRRKKLVKKCFEDGVWLRGYSQKIDSWRDSVMLFHKHTLIEVRFSYNGKKYKRRSSGKEIGSGVARGYSSVFAKYADREVDIIYSPKQDEVLILRRDKSKNTVKHMPQTPPKYASTQGGGGADTSSASAEQPKADKPKPPKDTDQI